MASRGVYRVKVKKTGDIIEVKGIDAREGLKQGWITLALGESSPPEPPKQPEEIEDIEKAEVRPAETAKAQPKAQPAKAK
jgi:hypothetical protein